MESAKKECTQETKFQQGCSKSLYIYHLFVIHTRIPTWQNNNIILLTYRWKTSLAIPQHADIPISMSLLSILLSYHITHCFLFFQQQLTLINVADAYFRHSGGQTLKDWDNNSSSETEYNGILSHSPLILLSLFYTSPLVIGHWFAAQITSHRWIITTHTYFMSTLHINIHHILF